MKCIRLHEDSCRRLSFYLAMEEYLARNMTDEVFLVWQAPPAVIVGRNQLIETEVNLGYCREHGIQVFRRKSGGGCVYSDMGNLMVSCITDGNDVPFIFETYMRRLALFLCTTGIRAEVSGRNDILVNGRKVSGNAFYSMHGRNIMHGTLLWNSDLTAMEQALTPSSSKLRSKGVGSVRQRVANLKEAYGHAGTGAPADAAALRDAIVRSFCDSERYMTVEEVHEIESLEKSYLDPGFIHGCNPPYTLSREVAVPGSGLLTFSLSVRNGKILKVGVSGDCMQGTERLRAELERLLKGRDSRRSSLLDALGSMTPGDYIRGLSVESIADALASD